MSDTKNNVRLLVAGAEFQGWKSVRIGAGIERQARSFELEVTDSWPGASDIPRRIQPGDLCQLYIGDDLVLTGFIDATPIKYNGRQVTVSVKGRSKTADLVDACPIVSGTITPLASASTWAQVKGKDGVAGAVIKPPAKASGQWRNQKLEVIASALAAPYGVRVVSEIDTGKAIADHQVQQGETVFESIDRMMRLRQVLSTDNALGDLVLIDVGSAGQADTALVLGENIREASAELDYTGVFSEYVCKGQRAGSDEEYGSDVAEESATASDSRARRRRVLVIRQSGQADEGTCKDRAEYEKAHRAAKALETVYTVAGWRQASGALWVPNLMVRVQDSLIGFNAEMVVAEVSLMLDADGLRTELRVGPPDGYRATVGKLKASKSLKGGGPDWSDVKG